MSVELLHFTPLFVCSRAIRTCWDSHAKSDCGGELDRDLIHRIGNINKHKSTLEHLYYNFEIIGISRACLQELARHRMASLSVKSTRYTLKELKNESEFINLDSIKKIQKVLDSITESTLKNAENLSLEKIIESNLDFAQSESLKNALKRAAKYIILSQNESVNLYNLQALENLRILLQSGIKQDIAKYALPECYKSRLVWSINARSLQNFLSLRSNKRALHEIRILAHNIFNALPNEHKYLFLEFLEPLDSNISNKNIESNSPQKSKK
ncbi:FAD-dependent thymidylate synthase [Helicobacter saguini]|uniref:Flavin-dependent thymidylate synthase n=1 Tax=Helicobacter saguini TaxID=1548018 RepID=A0A347VMB9_9HELI|nr:FAD-dependent thymidylate synthase [Helicobacter saguini]MWV62547.1 FAD-dependent thymidylate synthase [Helicobacter saguini]MWV66779.1 FAD-dependent thymidylate synthase [Helicobacter saguini]MWV69130.1 FAD-dependent thymidylate synthase [Helicobacter saguini]MWV71315.1 FAD-dependent thymidylate synthase [Helicobacter saguini]TLD94241.1 FAD-dependent thymidylate synthase [Helicobacter saguini]